MAITATFWAKPASRSVKRPAPTVSMWPKTKSAAYQPAIATRVARSGCRAPDVRTVTIEATSPPKAKLATSHPRPVASTR